MTAFAVLLAVLLIPWFLRWYYSFPFQEAVFAHARTVGVDPYLVAAVIKAESNFRPQAVSPRGARGLMQLMPETGRWVAEQLDMLYHPNYLFDPHYNVRLGTWYLSYLLREFDGNLYLTLAAYNSGEGRVKGWIAGGEVNRLEEIPYPETRRFVRQVLRHYRIYRELYGSSNKAKGWKIWLAER